MADEETEDDPGIVAMDLIQSIDKEFSGNGRAVTVAELARAYGKMALIQELMVEIYGLVLSEVPGLHENSRTKVIEQGLRDSVRGIGADLSDLAKGEEADNDET